MSSTTAPIIYHPAADQRIPPASAIGGKAHQLARLGEAGLPVPRWFAVPVAVFEAVVGPIIEHSRTGSPETLRETILSLRLPSEVDQAFRAALRESGLADTRVAVRSSAAAEDSAGASFAGQFDTVLNVQGEESILAAVRRVWASAFNPHATAYGKAGSMGVIVQELVDADVSGVAFGIDPVSGDDRTVVVNAVYGLGEGLVSGELDADGWRIRAEPGSGEMVVTERAIADKAGAVRTDAAGGTRLESVGQEERGRLALADEEVLEIARTVRELGERFGAPQDVEWAIVGPERRLVLLQARPVTAAGTGTGEERRLWDNSNIVESYAGITSPLTFSFARTVYEDVYRQFCAVVGVSAERIDRNRHVFANMLGLIRGRVYYNLFNWYRVLALLPGFALNRAFMERMMGVSEKLDVIPDSDVEAGKLRDVARVGRMVGRLARENRRLRQEVPAFHAHVREVLRPLDGADLDDWSADRLLALYRRLEDELLRKWQTPIVNDFFAMIWFGVLGRLVESWLPDEPKTLVNDLLTHEGGIVSTEPSRRVAELAEAVRTDPAARDAFAAEPDDAALLATIHERFPGFEREMREYLTEFGDRSVEELKLETVTMREDPALLVGAIRGYLEAGIGATHSAPAAHARLAAEERVRERLGGVRLAIFRMALRNARERVRDRENLRLERTRVFGLVRRIFLGFGQHFVRAGLFDSPRDVFHLTVQEVFSHVDGTSTAGELRGLVALRRERWREYAEAAPPPERFESIGPPELGRWIRRGPAAPSAVDGELQGVGCCPGLVRAPVRLVRDPTAVRDLGGHILVAERTDPGWTLLFPQARGILVERGSLLSHSAIVAREMGVPCVVAVPGLMATLRDGEEVEMDGTTGTITRIDPP